ncbi:hypothetical protein [Halobellus rufus]|uniref:hypothetical protein n=1 Tax=Halobellus rufus TaxID=1448860 RepID=UPI000679C014|nr:hypothetical protein [Halobellus rufus]
MFLRAIAFVIGVLEVAFTRPFVDYWMDLAAVDDDVELHSWVYTVARIEGFVFVLWALSGCRSRASE